MIALVVALRYHQIQLDGVLGTPQCYLGHMIGLVRKVIVWHSYLESMMIVIHRYHCYRIVEQSIGLVVDHIVALRPELLEGVG